VTTAIPHESTEAEFNSIFDPLPQNGKKKVEAVISTLNNALEQMNPYAYAEQDEDGGLQWQDLNEQSANGETRHLDGAPRDIPHDRMRAHLLPYRPPPPPQPFDEFASTLPKKRASKAKDAKPRQKRTTIIVTLTEFTDPSGEKSYAASGTPIIRVPNSEPQTENNVWEEGPSKPVIRQPFLDRMRIRQQRWQEYREDRTERSPWQREEMLLISVKRQRKMKMKKHKYKKLMRRTRNLRRKLGRL
jgi:hypothetical protein